MALEEAVKEQTAVLRSILDAIASTTTGGGGGGGGGEGSGGGLRFGMGGGVMSQITGAAEAAGLAATAIAAMALAAGDQVEGLREFGNAVAAGAGAARTLTQSVAVGQGTVGDVTAMFAPFALAGLDVPQGMIAGAVRIAGGQREAVNTLRNRVTSEAGSQGFQTLANAFTGPQAQVQTGSPALDLAGAVGGGLTPGNTANAEAGFWRAFGRLMGD